ncbi:hypothetical protein [Methylobacterium sp. J-077]|uniref:hypothetical protein n=1 Tax=Methylobacterium sp. J-077 TaxID=2836656 RepID=UPI001FBA4993|nr:hypothetical protein [Methylobacterium sp. J-077]MCJ2121206.1 hypothetical protein [Methylobacterium sp. J-077]
MPDRPTANTQDLAETEYDAQRRARAAAGQHPAPPAAGTTPASSEENPKADSPDAQGPQHG